MMVIKILTNTLGTPPHAASFLRELVDAPLLTSCHPDYFGTSIQVWFLCQEAAIRHQHWFLLYIKHTDLRDVEDWVNPSEDCW